MSKDIFKIELPFSPDLDLKNAIKEKITQKLDDQVKIEFIVNNNIVGGPIITYKGRYFNYSLSRLIETEIE